jgi:DNA-binding transcriptional LysR family regulator
VKDIFALRLYTRVAWLGNFSAAARECGLSQSQASRIIAELEADLGTRLLSRSTRAVNDFITHVLALFSAQAAAN